MRKFVLFVTLLSFVFATKSCKDPEPTEVEIINSWIWDVMNDVYLWADEVDQNLYPTEMDDPEQFFESLLYEEDRFSWIVDDYQELLNSFNNIDLSNGISPYFIRVGSTNEVIAVVEYVADNSPASDAGVKRGDIISEINGTVLDVDNFSSLFYADQVTLGFSDYVNGTLVANDREVSLTSEIVEVNPVAHHEIIEFEGSRIGYITYTGFSEGDNLKWVDSMNNVIAEFQTEGISEVIMDIRYNPGGRVSVANHIAAMLSPSEIPAGDNVFVNFRWNDDYQQYFEAEEGENSGNLVVFFEEDPGYNLDLTDVYFLTGWHSASASELIIIGLDPYMNVVQVGENTYGKFYGSITIPDTEEPTRHNWAMQPLVFKFANSVGYTDFYNGLTPDIEVNDDLLNLKPFGDITDPVIAAAIEDITGVSPIAKKSVSQRPDYTLLPDPVRESRIRTELTTPRLLKPGMRK